MSFWGYSDYVSVADRRAKAAREAAKLKKQGRALAPIAIEGRKIATRFWGKAWCDNLDRYSDFANRLPRGRSYVSNGLVIDLNVTRAKVEALVCGSELYKVKIEIAAATPARWQAICADCAGSVGSLVELLQGKLSKHVMERVCRVADGLFPAPKEIKLSCSCPDGAAMCKHVAATLYGVGARLDGEPELLFTLRGVDRGELISSGAHLSIAEAASASGRVLADDDLSALFGLEIEAPVGTKPHAGGKKPQTAVKPASARVAAPAKRADAGTRAKTQPDIEKKTLPRIAKSSVASPKKATPKSEPRLVAGTKWALAISPEPAANPSPAPKKREILSIAERAPLSVAKPGHGEAAKRRGRGDAPKVARGQAR
jgi:uncharacterized Zn finger protein